MATDCRTSSARLYRLRNAQEHLNDFSGAIEIDDPERLRTLGSLRAYQAEQLALSAYRRLLTAPGLIERVRDDNAVDAFWALPTEQRQAAWGPTFDLDQAEQEHNRMMAIIGVDE